MDILLVVNDPAYGSERAYNALRLAGSLAKRDEVRVRVFLMGDAVTCAVVVRHGGEVGCCGTCLDARALTDVGLVDGARRSTLEELTDWTLAADKTVVF